MVKCGSCSAWEYIQRNENCKWKPVGYAVTIFLLSFREAIGTLEKPCEGFPKGCKVFKFRVLFSIKDFSC